MLLSAYPKVPPHQPLTPSTAENKKVGGRRRRHR